MTDKGQSRFKLQPLPPVWLLGMGFLPLGAFGALMLITVPALLAAEHVPEPHIASVTAIALLPGFVSFVLAPLLDWRFSRRIYAILFAVLAGLCAFGALLLVRRIAWLTTLLFVGDFAASLCVAAVGGWFGSLTHGKQAGSLGAWFTVSNLAGGGVVATLAIPLLRDLPQPLGAALLALIVVASVPLYLVVDCPPADSRLAGESFREFARDVLSLLRRPSVLWTLLLFGLPSASFALTNTLGGLGRDFHTSEQLVGFVGGVGVTVAGVVGSLIVPRLSRLVPGRPLYLLVGGVGTLFTLGLTLAPHNSVTFGLAMLGENVFQAAAFSVANLIILRTIGDDNSLAATQFGLLTAACVLPLSYMQVIDGRAYALGGVTGSYLADAGVSGGVCVLLAALSWFLRRRIAAI